MSLEHIANTVMDIRRVGPKADVTIATSVTFASYWLMAHIAKFRAVNPDIELKVVASNIPDELVADLTGLDVNDVIRISDITLPEGASPVITDRDFMIANISAPSVLRAEGEEAEQAAAPTPVESAEE